MPDNNEIKFGTDGWRGIIGDNYTFKNLKILSQAVADYLGLGKKVAVGFDTRFMSETFAKVVAEVLKNNGIIVLLSDRAIPTPPLSFTVRNKSQDLGIIKQIALGDYHLLFGQGLTLFIVILISCFACLYLGIFSTGMPISVAISSAKGSRPKSWLSRR